MAQRTIVQFTDDMDGTEAAGTVSFALDGDAYEIDLSESNAEKLRASLAEFVQVARKLPKTGPRAATQRSGGTAGAGRNPDAAEARKWAVDNGITVPERGRVPGLVVEAFKASKRGDDEALNRAMQQLESSRAS